jgi:hypothetical protein
MSQLYVPDGYFADNHMVFGDLGKGGVLSRGYAVEFPDLSASDDQAFIDLESDIRLILGSLRESERLQLSVHTSSDFSRPLDRFAEETEKSQIKISSEVRNELVSRYRNRVANERLIQANARLYLSSKLPAFVKESGRVVRGFEEIFRIESRSFEQRAMFFDLLFQSYGGSVKGLDNVGHYDEFLTFWSPGQARQPRFKDLDWLRPIANLCRFSGLSPRQPPATGFYLDGYYVGLLVARTLPRATWGRTMEP